MPPSGKAKCCAQPVCHVSSQIFSHPASTDRVNLLHSAVLPFAFVTLYYLTLECAAFSGPARAIPCGPHISRTLGFLPSGPTWFMIRLLFYLFKPYLTYISLFSDSSTPDSNKLLRVINLNKYIWIHQNNSSWLAI